MVLDKFIVITGRKGRYGGWVATAKIVEREPRLSGDEVSLHLKIELPDALFERPKLEAKMKIPDEAVPKGKLSYEITDNLEKIIKQATGLKMVVSVVEQPEEKDGK